MRVRQIKTTIILGTISLLGIIIIQIYWLFTVWNSNRNDLEEDVWQALRQVTAEANEINNCQAGYRNPVTKISETCYMVDGACAYCHYTLKHLITKSFLEHHVKIEYELAIYNCEANKLEYIGKYSEAGELITDVGSLQACMNKTNANSPYFFCINLSGLTVYMLKQMQLWLILSLFVLIIVSFFAYAIFTSFRQKQLNELQKDFINNMTHEFKTPISSIGIASDVVLDEQYQNQIPERVINYAKIIKQENSRLNTLVENVLKSARIEKNRTIIEKESVDIHELIDEVFSGSSYTQISTEVSIVKDLKANRSIIYADRLHITNVLFNLLDNAIKYSSDNCTINVSSYNSGNKFYLVVEDTGIGINKKYQKRVFNKFFRIPTGDLHNVKGFGLGLFYVKEVCKLHGWKIDLQSEPGKGSIFKFKMNLHG